MYAEPMVLRSATSTSGWVANFPLIRLCRPIEHRAHGDIRIRLDASLYLSLRTGLRQQIVLEKIIHGLGDSRLTTGANALHNADRRGHDQHQRKR